MSTFNREEPAKVKHILLLAQAINGKLPSGDNSDGDRLTPTLSLSTASFSNVTTKYEAITYSGDGELYVEAYPLTNLISAQVITNNNTTQLYLQKVGNTAQTETYTYKLKATATDNYKAAELTFTVAP